MITVTLNGVVQQTDQATVLALLEDLQMTKGRFAVEIDGMLVPKSRLADTVLTDGLTIEVVQAVGGG
ncbi:MAG: sulfur carrier protein ThiS [Moraxella sp.]|nr:sulfur carrier protein ThiS [Moraxella sp.]